MVPVLSNMAMHTLQAWCILVDRRRFHMRNKNCITLLLYHGVTDSRMQKKAINHYGKKNFRCSQGFKER